MDRLHHLVSQSKHLVDWINHLVDTRKQLMDGSLPLGERFGCLVERVRSSSEGVNTSSGED